MLRGRVDMLYEVGIDAVDSLSLSTQTKVFTFERPYAFLVFLNVRNPKLQDKALRRALNAAIDRDALVAEALNGHGTPADGPVWPHHWSLRSELPRFQLSASTPWRCKQSSPMSCLILSDQSHERVGLAIQRQLRAVGVELAIRAGVTPTSLLRVCRPAILKRRWVIPEWAEPAASVPVLVLRCSLNWGRFSSARVDGSSRSHPQRT